MWYDFAEIFGAFLFIGIFCFRIRARIADRAFAEPAFDDSFKPVKRAAAYEKDIGGIYLDKFLIRVFPSSLRRDIRNCPFNYFKQRLLNAFARYVSSYRTILASAGDLIYFVNIYDARLGTRNIKVRRLYKP